MKKITLLTIMILLSSPVFAQQPSPKEIKIMANLGEFATKFKTDTIPIHIYNNEIILETKINGEAYNLMWDNGFSFSAIDKTLVDKIGMTNYKGQKNITGTDAIDKKVTMDLKMAKELTLNNVVIEDTPFLVIDVVNIFGSNKEVQGILGSTVIKMLNWKFNFDESYVVISKKPFKAKGPKIPFGINDWNLMYTTFKVNDVDTEIQIDFGLNSDDIQLTYEAMELFKDTPKSRVYGITMSSVSGFDGNEASYNVKDFDYEVGGFTFDYPIELFLSKSESQAKIGNQPFRHYNCVFNSTSKEIILAPRATAMKEETKKSFGANILNIDGKLVVSATRDNPNTLANPALKPGLEIVEINGKNISEFEDNFALKNYQLDLIEKNEALNIKTIAGKQYILKAAFNIYK